MFHYNYTKLRCQFILILSLFFLSSCNWGNDKPNPPDISDVSVNVSLERFEQALFAIDTTKMHREVDQLKKEYPLFFDCFIEDVMGIKHPRDTSEQYIKRLKSLLNYGGFRAAYDSTMEKYGNIDFLTEDIRQSYRYFHHYFPHKPKPDIVTFISEYGYGVITCGDSIVGIGLDLYLGKDFKFYPTMRIPDYMIAKLEKEYIMPNVMKQVYNLNFHPKEVKKNTMLKRIINNGRRLYFLDLTLPYKKDWYKIGFQEKELKWCRNNEPHIWGLFIEKELVYSNKYPDYRKYISEAPNSPGMPHKAPGNTGTWIGWQIVRKFMKERPNVTFEEMVTQYEPKEILIQSNYKPKTNWL